MIDLLGPPMACLVAIGLLFVGLPWTVERITTARHHRDVDTFARFARQQHALRRASRTTDLTGAGPCRHTPAPRVTAPRMVPSRSRFGAEAPVSHS